METQDRIALAVLERDVVHLDKGLSEVKADMNKRFDATDKKIDRLDERMSSNFKWLLGTYGGGVILILGFVYFLFSRI